MKFLAILIFMPCLVMAEYRVNPYTQQRDYYEGTAGLKSDVAAINGQIVSINSNLNNKVSKTGDTMTGQLNVSSNIVVSGNVIGGMFYGDGTMLTGLVASDTSTIVGATISNYTLGSGSTFYTFTSPSEVEIIKMSVVPVDIGDNGFSEWRCGTASNFLAVTTSTANTVGYEIYSSGPVSIGAGERISCLIVASNQPVTPTANLELLYRRKQ